MMCTVRLFNFFAQKLDEQVKSKSVQLGRKKFGPKKVVQIIFGKKIDGMKRFSILKKFRAQHKFWVQKKF